MIIFETAKFVIVKIDLKMLLRPHKAMYPFLMLFLSNG